MVFKKRFSIGQIHVILFNTQGDSFYLWWEISIFEMIRVKSRVEYNTFEFETISIQ